MNKTAWKIGLVFGTFALALCISFLLRNKDGSMQSDIQKALFTSLPPDGSCVLAFEGERLVYGPVCVQNQGRSLKLADDFLLPANVDPAAAKSGYRKVFGGPDRQIEAGEAQLWVYLRNTALLKEITDAKSAIGSFVWIAKSNSTYKPGYMTASRDSNMVFVYKDYAFQVRRGLMAPPNFDLLEQRILKRKYISCVEVMELIGQPRGFDYHAEGDVTIQVMLY